MILPLDSCCSSKKTGSNSKPTSYEYSSRSPRGQRTRRPFHQSWVILGVLAVLSVFFYIRNTREADNPTSSVLLKAAANSPQIFSHQLLNAPPSSSFWGSAIVSPPDDGSLDAMTMFWKAGITCFDIDIVTLQDGTLLASHPVRLEAAIQQGYHQLKHMVGVGDTAEIEKAVLPPHSYTLEQVRAMGADTNGFPLLNDVLSHYAHLVHPPSHRSSAPAFFEPPSQLQQPNQERSLLTGPLLNLDLKGPQLTADHLTSILKQLDDLSLSRNVLFCVSSLLPGEIGPGVDILTWMKHQKEWHPSSLIVPPIMLGLVLRDRVSEDQEVGRILRIVSSGPNSSLFRALIPSLHFSKAWFEEVHRQVRLPMVAWTVDTVAQVEYGRDVGVVGVVANRPMDFVS